MTTTKQDLGAWGEQLVAKHCSCPKCKKTGTYKRLPTNFKCADLICDFCGFLAQVKAANVKSINPIPKQILGAAWEPQKETMQAAIYFPLYLALKSSTEQAVFYLPADFQNSELFVPRKPLSQSAKRAGWQGFIYDLTKISNGALIKLL